MPLTRFFGGLLMLALLVGLTLAGAANGAERVSADFRGVSPAAGGQAFGIYNLDITDSSGQKGGPVAAHCIQRSVGAGSGPATLLTGEEVTLPSKERIFWLVSSSELSQRSPSPGLTPGQEAAAHQSAIWQITDPNHPNIVPNDSAAAARAQQLLSASVGAEPSKPASLQAIGATDCRQTTRIIEVTGAPSGVVNLTLSGPATFGNGAQVGAFTLDANGVVRVEVLSQGIGTVLVSGTVQVDELVQAVRLDKKKQDFTFVRREPVNVQTQFSFIACPPPTGGNTPNGGKPGDDSSTRQRPSGRTTVDIAKVASRKAATTGETLTYRIIARNTGRVAARKLVITDKLPRGQVLVRRSGGLTIESGRLVWQIGKLAPGRSIVRTFTVRLLDSSAGKKPRCNTATATGRNFDRRTAQVCVTIESRPPRRTTVAVTG